MNCSAPRKLLTSNISFRSAECGLRNDPPSLDCDRFQPVQVKGELHLIVNGAVQPEAVNAATARIRPAASLNLRRDSLKVALAPN